MINDHLHGAEGISCVHFWRKIVTPHGVFTNYGAALIYEGTELAEDTPQVIHDQRFHKRAKRTEVSSWLLP